MPNQVQILPNGDQLQLGPNGQVKTVPRGISDADLVGSLLQPRQDPRASSFGPYAAGAAGMYGNYAGLLGTGIQAFGSMPNAYASAMNGYGNLLGNVATAAANTDAARYGAYAKNTSDYQNMLGSMGVGALGAFGNASNAAMQSHALRETAMAKMFSDSLSANQQALASYGGQQAASQAALGAAAANAGSGLAAARAGLGNAYSSLGSAGMGALANVAGNSMNYTRDMAKLDLARTLGGGAINAATNIGASLGAGLSGSGLGGGGGRSYSISGPGGTIASAGGAPAYRTGNDSVAQRPSTGGSFDPGQGWYSAPQYYDAGGKDSVLNALASSQAGIDSQSRGIDRDAGNTFDSINRFSERVADKSILDSLNSNFRGGWGDMLNVYNQGRGDSRAMMQDAYRGILGISSPFLTAGREAFGTTMNNMPRPSNPVGGLLGNYMSGMDRLVNTQNNNILGTLTEGRTGFNNSMNALGQNFGNTMNAIGQSGGGGAGGTGMEFVWTTDGWKPIGAGFHSPNTQHAIDTGRIQDPRYSNQPPPGQWSMPGSGGFGGTAGGSFGGLGSSGANYEVQRATLANQLQAVTNRLQYYRTMTPAQQQAMQNNPTAQAEISQLTSQRQQLQAQYDALIRNR